MLIIVKIAESFLRVQYRASLQETVLLAAYYILTVWYIKLYLILLR